MQLVEQIGQADPNNPHVPLAAYCGRGFVSSTILTTVTATGYAITEVTKAAVDDPIESTPAFQTLYNAVEGLCNVSLTTGVLGGAIFYVGMRHTFGRALDLRDRQIEDGLRRLIADSE